jgi:hypothetical protein
VHWQQVSFGDWPKVPLARQAVGVVGIFPNEASTTRLIMGLLIDYDEAVFP